MYLNKVFLFGNLTRDPELRSLPSGIQVSSFSLATNRRFKKDNVWQEASEFHNIVVFGRQADSVSQYLKKGSSAFIEGRLQTRSWDGEKGKQYRTEIIADRIQFGPRAGGSGGGGSSMPSRDSEAEQPAPKDDAIAYPEEDINPDDIPF